MEEIASDLRT